MDKEILGIFGWAVAYARTQCAGHVPTKIPNLSSLITSAPTATNLSEKVKVLGLFLKGNNFQMIAKYMFA